MSQEIFKKIKKKWQTFLAIVFAVTAIAFSVSVFMPSKYASQTKMIIIQDHQSSDVDAFSAAKSAEYLSDIISNIIFTESFLQDVLDSPFQVKKDFSYSAEEKMKIWEKTVDVKKENNTGILVIRVYEKSRIEAEKIAESISWALNTRGLKYHGGGESVEIKNIDGPITSENPVVPNVLVNTLLGFIVGILGAFVVINFFDDFELELLPSGKKRSNKKVDQMALKLEKIREDLKNKKIINFDKEEDYQVEKATKEEKAVDDNEENFVKEEIRSNEDKLEEEFVKVIEDEKPEEVSGKKSEAPQNLPIFTEESEEVKEDNGSKNGFISMEELNKEAERMGLTDESNLKEQEQNPSKYEASSEEVKERLNKLLRGEL